ncbi:hypothetical protein CPHO_06235 [Corynebacterium phocae]|uniref:BFN domain-containing protein n=1 Tax=Corynebacterium phocae TaxID=161895 RepID=A0A1L7D315_9CORY|nr:hypothetical protein [Corynebacterium phocae]APT92556.1 hypothetical protein CPHO_06235 [Corynebacterium phocae]KAA8725158.1 hypothetical protein F4V58_05780 [Corynebacterium phocae]
MSVSLEYLGNSHPGSEGWCFAFQLAGQHKVIPVWATGPEADLAAAITRDVDDGQRHAIISLIDLLEELGGVTVVELVSSHEGSFVFDVTAATGHTFEVSPVNAVVIASHFKVSPVVEEDVAAQVAVFATPDDLREYLDVEYATPADDAGVDPNITAEAPRESSQDSQVDADFEELVRGLDMGDFDLDDGGSGEK